jgi:muconolactone delta-isomerase
MRFLIIAKSKHLVPPEVLPGVVDATLAWARKHQGKTEQLWGFAGIQGGGGIANVESLEELDTIMTEFPLGAFSELEVYPLVDLEPSLQRVKRAAQAMAASGRG